ncbi:Fibronectin type III domain-containing protein [Chryseobacterium limigenitum]|uniref:Fibronectin type III domain-containing protein n=2 Tax=Chryseobacterium limigenitum TaxID=1612149 RepID=A0A1K2IXX5_9FLAO|nr:Fibronectin type III domain-containing protein [Chryseobacterium limigenitum]
MNHSYNDKIKYNPYSRPKFKNFGIKIWALMMLMFFGLQSISVKAQQYPVKLVPVVIPPYSMRLGDYATSTDNKLQLQVLMTDLMEPQHQTGIKFTLEAGLNAVPFARSNDFIVGMNPFLLYPGSNVTLTNVDLRALFELQNLGGINASQYSQPLSDGVYQFCFQAYDYYTKNNLSSKTCATVFLTQYDPPMLNLPQNAEKVQAMSPYAGGSGIVFQWMPRQIAPNTKYIFTLKELWDAGQSPISGFLSSPPLWQEETYAPTLYYGLDKTQLIPGKRYAWQVQAKSGNPVLGANPTEDNGVYKNNGFSEIYYFDYVENCTIPTLLMAKNVGRGRVEISWSLGGQPAGLYNVQYRKKNSNTEWMTQQSYQSPATLTGLEDLTEYEYRVGSVCGNIQDSGNAYSYSAIQYFTTNANDVDNNYQCGIMPAIDIANKNPLQTMLGVNEVFTAGDFPVTVLAAQGSNGIYSGTGFIQVPYLADTKVKVSFNNIKLNTDKKLIEGVIETTYDPNETAVNYASAGIGETFGDAGVKDVFVNFPIGNITYSATPPPGKITITGSDGNGGTGSTTEYPGGKDYTFTDSNGVIWTVDENGTVTKGGTVAQGGASTSTNTDGVTGSGNNATINQYTAKGIKIEWKENVNGQFAYDTAEKTKLPKDKYPSVKDSENNTAYVPYKATVNKKTELFDAKVSITDPTLKDATIIFKTLSIGKAIEATEINKTDTERNYQLKLIGAFDYAEEEVIAVLMPKDSTSKQKVISSFRLVHLSPKTVNVSLVPLDANSQSKLQLQSDKLTDIYKKIGITFNVTKDPILDVSSIVSGDTISSEDADLMSTYSPQQQQINALYKGTGSRYVLFVTDKKSSTGQKGYMRLNGQFGYIYNNAQDKTGAHELGHGVFKLEHPWKDYGTTQSATPLLMDYSTGEELSHLDWKQINDPAFKLYAFQGQSSGEFANYVISPNYRIVSLPKPNSLIYEACDFDNNKKGLLYGFSENNKTYCWKEVNNVYDYYEKITNSKYPGEIKTISTPKDGDKVTLFFDITRPCPSKELNVDYSEIEGKLDTTALNKYISDNTAKAIDVPCGEGSYTSSFFEIDDLEVPPGATVIRQEGGKLSAEQLKKSVDQLNQLIVKNNAGYAYKKDMSNSELGNISVGQGITAGGDRFYKVDHRLVYLSEFSKQKNNPVNIYVVYTKVDFLVNGNWNEYAKQVYESSNLKNKNAILITAPYFEASVDRNGIDFSVQHYMPGVYAKGIDINTNNINKIKATNVAMANGGGNMYQAIFSDNVTDFIEQVYKQTYKPYKIHLGTRYADGTISADIVESQENKPGYNFVHGVMLRENKNYQAIQDLPIPKAVYVSGGTGGAGYSVNPNYEKELLKYELDKAALLQQALETPEWILTENSIEFKEKYLTDVVANKYIVGYAYRSGLNKWSQDLGNVYKGIVGEVPTYEFDNTYNKDNWSTVDPIIYGAIDVAGIGLSLVGADSITDGIGLMYALKRGDVVNASIYTAAIVLPIIASGELKLAKLAADSKVFYRGAIYTWKQEGKLVLSSNSYVRGRLLEFFKLSDNAVTHAELDAFTEAFKKGNVTTSEIKNILNQSDPVIRAEMFGKFLSNTGAKYGIKEISTEAGLIDLLPNLLKKEGLTMDDFHYIMQTPADKLSATELSKITNIRNAIAKPTESTLMQKVMPKSAIENYLKEVNPYTTVGGFVTKAADAKHLKSYEDLYFGLRLDYVDDSGKLYNYVEDGSCGVIRFQSKQSKDAIVPAGAAATEKYPFTNHGFTSGNHGRLGAPEWKLNGYNNYFDDGAELWEVYNDGSEVLRAVYSKSKNRFVKK